MVKAPVITNIQIHNSYREYVNNLLLLFTLNLLPYFSEVSIIHVVLN